MLEVGLDLDGIAAHLVIADVLAPFVDDVLGGWRAEPATTPLAAAAAAAPAAAAASRPQGLAPLEISIAPSRAAPAPPAEAPRFHFPPMLGHSEGGGWRYWDPAGTLQLDPDAGRVEGTVFAGAPPDALAHFVGVTLWLALVECLRARGRFPIHAAILVAPDGRTLALPGRSRSGKSTAALGLSGSGYRLVSDDGAFVFRRPGGGLGLTGIRRPLHVGRDVLDRRPELAAGARPPRAWERQDKVWLPVGTGAAGGTSAGADSAAGAFTRAGAILPAPSILAFPVVVPDAASIAETLSAREALAELLAHSILVFVDPRRTEEHVAVLRDLVDRARCLRLRCGRDVLDRPARYDELLRHD